MAGISDMGRDDLHAMVQAMKKPDPTFIVKFEDGKTYQMTAEQVNKLKDRRKWEVVDPKGVVILRKTYRGI